MFHKTILFILAAFMCFSLSSWPVIGADKYADWVEIKMRYSPDWNTLKNIVTPAIEYPEVEEDGYITLPNTKNPDGFICTVEGSYAEIDTDGDNNMETIVKKRNNLIQFKITYGNDIKSQYQLRVWQNGKTWSGDVQVPKWSYQRGGFMQGKAAGDTIILIDDNNNGLYNDYGKDSICIGRNAKFGGYLSQIVTIKNKLYELEVDPSGLKIRIKKYTAKTGKIDVKKKLDFPKNSPGVVMLKSKDLYINIFPTKKPSTLPIGEYTMVAALFDRRLRARQGSLPPIKIEEGEKTLLEWGKPFKLIFEPRCDSQGQLVTFIPPTSEPPTPPRRIPKVIECPFIKMDLPTAVVGKNGEEYFGSPEFKDPKGHCMPDANINSFEVSIVAKKPAEGIKTRKGEELNKIGNLYVDRWIQVDMSGIVEKKPPWWETYQCPLYDYRGIVTIKVSAKSAIFGNLTFEKDMEITYEDPPEED